jgi:hypothetical protein
VCTLRRSRVCVCQSPLARLLLVCPTADLVALRWNGYRPTPSRLMSTERLVPDLHFTRVKSNAGDVIIQEGAAVDAYFLVEWGNISITQDGQHLATKGKGAHFEHLWSRASETVVANKFTEVIKVDKAQYEQHVRPTFFGDVEELRDEDVSELLTQLIFESGHQNPKVRSAVPFISQLGVTFVMVIGGFVLAVNLALDSGWQPWRTCNSCDKNAPEPSSLLHIFYGISLALAVAAATVSKRYLDM